MKRTMLRAKLHRVTVTATDVHYEGSCAIDEALLEAADIREFEQIDLYDVDNGARFTTYAVKAPRGSGTIAVMGAAARLVSVGDLVIIASYAQLEESELAAHRPRLVYVDAKNHISDTRYVPSALRP
jgi:aspartate 1-decarboxylase